MRRSAGLTNRSAKAAANWSLPKGKTKPRGASCLGTARFGAHHRLQVTYHGKQLYTFVDDSGHSVRGNDFQGCKVAKKIRCTT